MNQAQQMLHDMFEAYKNTSEYKDRSMMEIMMRKNEFEENLNQMWDIYRRGYLQQVVEYKKAIREIKDAGLTVLRNKAGQHKIVFKK